MFKISGTLCLIAGAALSAAGCSPGMTDTNVATQLLSISPRSGAVGLSTSPDILLTFSGPMMAGMEQYLALHQGGVTGPTQPMGCTWSDGQRTLSCRPGQPLMSATSYTIHMGGGMMDADGLPVGMERHGMEMGGQWAAGGMMGGQSGMMGSGWMHANGSYGMVFGFTTQ
jgi:hypothetical protein